MSKQPTVTPEQRKAFPKATSEQMRTARADVTKQAAPFIQKLQSQFPSEADKGRGVVPHPEALKQYLTHKDGLMTAWLDSHKVRDPHPLIKDEELTMTEQKTLPTVATTPTAAEEKAAATAAADPKASARKFEDVVEKHGTFRKGTVRHTIYLLLCRPADQALTVDQIAAEVHKVHPDHPLDSLKTSVRAKISDFPQLLNDFKLGRNALGQYSVNIQERVLGKPVDPDALAKREADKKAKAEAKAKRDEERKAKAEAQAKAKADRAAALAAKKGDIEKAKAEAKAKREADKAAKAEAAAKAKAEKAAANEALAKAKAEAKAKLEAEAKAKADALEKAKAEALAKAQAEAAKAGVKPAVAGAQVVGKAAPKATVKK